MSTWILLGREPGSEPFVQTDGGVALVTMSEAAPVNFLSSTTLRCFPLCPDLCVLMLGGTYDGQSLGTIVPPAAVRSINAALTLGARRFVMGASQAQLTQLQTALASKPPGWQPIITIS